MAESNLADEQQTLHNWTQQGLQAKRRHRDPLADAVIDELFEKGSISAVNGLMRSLVVNDGIVPEQLPIDVKRYLARSADLSCMQDMDSAKLEVAERMFSRHGPEILAILGFYGLPMDYACGKGVRVLHRTAFLSERPLRRVLETTQMVVDVMSPGGLAAEGRGLRTAQKVRLMHAAIRRLIEHDTDAPWDTDELGVPINQEDLAGTLLTFAYVVLLGLERLGIEVSKEGQESYFYCWRIVGHIMGVDDDLIPHDLEGARQLAAAIFDGQCKATPQGQALAADLIDGYHQMLPQEMHGVPASMMRLFLEHEQLSGRNVAKLLAIPPGDWTEHVASAGIKLEHLIQKYKHHLPGEKLVAGVVGRELVRGFLRMERGGKRAKFAIPEQLKDDWHTSA